MKNLMIVAMVLTMVWVFQSCKKDSTSDPSAAHCSNNVQDGDETGVDCGGSCTACNVPSTCSNGVQDGDETGIDCGGSCTACGTASTCSNGVQDGDETGVDCGGSCTACVEPITRNYYFTGNVDGQPVVYQSDIAGPGHASLGPDNNSLCVRGITSMVYGPGFSITMADEPNYGIGFNFLEMYYGNCLSRVASFSQFTAYFPEDTIPFKKLYLAGTDDYDGITKIEVEYYADGVKYSSFLDTGGPGQPSSSYFVITANESHPNYFTGEEGRMITVNFSCVLEPLNGSNNNTIEITNGVAKFVVFNGDI